MRALVRKSDLWRVWWRSFFIQGSWNFERMLALGFCFALIPVAKRVARNDQRRVAFLQRHLQFFNTHPFTALLVLGAVAKLEQSALRQKWQEDRPIRLFKERLCGPLGAIGDTLFWARAKPIAAMIGVIVAMHAGWWAVPLFLVVYNLPHLWFRAHALFQGFREGFDVVRRISVRRFQPLADRLALAGAAVLGVVMASSLRWLGPPRAVSMGMCAGCALISCLALRSGKVSLPALMVGLLVVGVLVGVAAS